MNISDSDFFLQISKHHREHSNESSFYKTTQKELDSFFDSISSHPKNVVQLGEIGDILFPFFKMGKITSVHLFGLDELILFAFYFKNRMKYKCVLDLGANIGLHSLILKRLGYKVLSFEPDPIHCEQFLKVMKLNGLDSEGLQKSAVSDFDGETQFLRILDNTTGSHLAGSKTTVYGPTDKFNVEVRDIRNLLNDQEIDLIKMDVEGHEFRILNAIPKERFLSLDIILEIGSRDSAKKIFELSENSVFSIYSQKTNWRKAEKEEDLPSHHSHGSAFLSTRGAPLWA